MRKAYATGARSPLGGKKKSVRRAIARLSRMYDASKWSTYTCEQFARDSRAHRSSSGGFSHADLPRLFRGKDFVEALPYAAGIMSQRSSTISFSSPPDHAAPELANRLREYDRTSGNEFSTRTIRKCARTRAQKCDRATRRTREKREPRGRPGRRLERENSCIKMGKPRDVPGRIDVRHVPVVHPVDVGVICECTRAWLSPKGERELRKDDGPR